MKHMSEVGFATVPEDVAWILAAVAWVLAAVATVPEGA
jgi:hypothetical protein